MASNLALDDPWLRTRGQARMAGDTLMGFLNANRGKITKGAGLLGGAGVLMGAADALNDPTRSDLNNMAGATGSAALGLGGVLTGAKIGGMVAGPWGAAAGAVLAPLIGSGVGESIGRGVAGLWEDPNATAMRQEEARRRMMREEGIKDLQARLPIEFEAATMKAALDRRAAEAQAQIDGQRLLQQGLIGGMMERTKSQGLQDQLLTQGLMQGVFG